MKKVSWMCCPENSILYLLHLLDYLQVSVELFQIVCCGDVYNLKNPIQEKHRNVYCNNKSPVLRSWMGFCLFKGSNSYRQGSKVIYFHLSTKIDLLQSSLLVEVVVHNEMSLPEFH